VTLDLEKFLESGSIFSLDDSHILIAYGPFTRTKKQPSTLSLFIPDFFLFDSSPWWIPTQYHLYSVSDLYSELKSAFSTERRGAVCWQPPSYDFFAQQFISLQKDIQRGVLEKGVPYVFETDSNGMDRFQLYQSILALLEQLLNGDEGKIYGCWSLNEGLLGMTPESLFSYDYSKNPRLETMACAGTCSAEADKNAFMKTEKERREHQIVVDSIITQLEDLGNVFSSAVKVHDFYKLSHLITTIEVDLFQSVDFMKLVHTLHPTPALGAYPKQAGMQWLLQYAKKLPRHRFGAPVGCVIPDWKKEFCYVAIRNVQWNRDKKYIGAGCGVVLESQLENEWLELQLKLATSKAQLALETPLLSPQVSKSF